MDVRDTDAGGIVCPHCFIALWHDTTDREVIWHLSIMEVTSSDIGPTSSDIERDSEGVGDCAPLPCEKRYEMCAKPLPTWPPGQSICSAPSKRAL